MEKTSNTGLEFLPYKFTAKELDKETGLYYYGARYLDPKYSRWISADPALGEYIPSAPVDEEAKRHNQNLPGMGGVFNTVNSSLYHYAGNNPVRYTDPDGRELFIFGSKQYVSEVHQALKSIYSGASVNYDTGEVIFSEKLDSKSNGKELLENLINSDNIHIIFIGQSKVEGNGCSPNTSTGMALVGEYVGSVVDFDPKNEIGGIDENGSRKRPSFIGLAHELGHSEAFDKGIQKGGTSIFRPFTTPPNEEWSLKRENDVRKENNQPLRPFYYGSVPDN